MEKTQPRNRNIDPAKDAHRLEQGRYGTGEMCDNWGPEETFLRVMQVQVTGLETINQLYNQRLPEDHVATLRDTANLIDVSPDRIREIESKGGHDGVAINTAWGEAAEKKGTGSSSIINFLRTTADNTETAKALQCKESFHVLAESIENLRDILLEKSMQWIDVPYMDQTHLLDALPSVAGRMLSFYAECLESNLNFIRYVNDNSLYAKWADATGNHHAAVAASIDGMKLQEEYARNLGLRSMIAPAQIPAREFICDIMYALARTGGTVANIGRNIRMGRGSDRSVFIYRKEGKKGSSAMPHKDLRGGNPDTEEQAESFLRYLAGNTSAVINSIVFDYGRDLTGSALDRLVLGPSFNVVDDTTRRNAKVVYGLEIDKERSLDRIERTKGIVTSPRVMTYLVDPAKTKNPMSRKEAHDMLGRCATAAYESGQQFYDVLLEEPEINARISPVVLLELTNPANYIGQSREIVRKAYDEFHGRKTF